MERSQYAGSEEISEIQRKNYLSNKYQEQL
jgi:hypothetical protein